MTTPHPCAYSIQPTSEDTPDHQNAILAGGCFWGMQELIRRLPGVVHTRVGYCAGHSQAPTYATLKGSGHAEAVAIRFATCVLSYRALLEFFFQIHDPTKPNRQGHDRGASYRSLIVALSPEQRATAYALIAAIDASGRWPGPVVTQVVDATPFMPFTEAEAEHQDYLQRVPHGYTCHFVRPQWRLSAVR